MQETIKSLMGEGVFLSPDLLDQDINIEALLSKIQKNKPVVFDKTSFQNIDKTTKVSWPEYDRVKVKFEKTGQTPRLMGFFEERKQLSKISNIKIIESYEDKNVKISMSDFVNLYNERYTALQRILAQRQELQGATTIRKVKTSQNNAQVSFIAMVVEVSLTKNNHYMMVLEDQTGRVKTIVTKNNKEAHSIAKDITPDEVIGVQGAKGNRVVFVNTIITPDIPLNKELKKSPEKEAAVFIGDLHVGAKVFLEENFERFLGWINGDTGTDKQKEFVKRVKYVFVLGDLVEGIGIYPGQEEDLDIKDIYAQYDKFNQYMKRIPSHINIIICPGNHDSLRVAEPQPTLTKELVGELMELPNISLVSSPSIVRIGEKEGFSGFDVLLYHGYSFPYYANNIESIRMNGGLERTDNIMEYLLKKRHLAPTHGSTQYQLGYEKDPLIIRNIPDFFVSGHIHRTTMKNYRNVTLLNCSCWISQTEYQEKRGLQPQPSRAIYVDLNTRQTKILNFEK